MVAILGGENPTRVMVLFPSPRTLPAQGAVVRAAVVDAVHVGHQNLAVPTHCVLVYIRPGAFIAHSWISALANSIAGVASKVMFARLCRENSTSVMVLLPGSCAYLTIS